MKERLVVALLMVPFLALAAAQEVRPFAGAGGAAGALGFAPGSDRVVVSGFEEGHAFLNWFPTGTVTTDVGLSRVGESSLRLASDGDGSPVAAEMPLPHAVDLRDASFRLWVRVDDPLALGELWLQATGDDWENHVTFPLEARLAPTDEGRWLHVATSTLESRTSGSRPVHLVDRIRIRAADRGERPVSVHADDLALVRMPDGGIVSITFDDGWASQYERAFPLMRRYGFVGTAFVVPYLIGSEHYMTEAMAGELYDAGWDLAGHYHPSLRGREDPELGHILRSVHDYLSDRGWERGARLFAYPQGYFDQPVLVPAVSRHFDAGRTIVQGLEPLPVADPMRLRSVTVLPETTVEEIQAALDAAREGSAWLILVFHRVVDEPEHPTEVAPERFEAILERIRVSGLPVRAVSDVLNGFGPHRQGP